MAAAALTGCSSSPDYAAVCVDEQTQERVSDYECDDDDHDSYGGSYGSSYIWYYLGSSQRVPSVGSRVSGGSTSEPSGSVQRGGLPSSGGSSVGSTDYGGFGSSSGHTSS